MPEPTGWSRPPHRHTTPRHGPAPMAALVLGGALGTLARYGVERGLPPDPSGFPWATWTVNVVGSFVLGAVLVLVTERWPSDRYLRPLVGVGFCGGFTTFSTLVVELDQRIQHGHGPVAAVYLVATLVAGLGAALAGTAVVRGRIRPVGHPDLPDPDQLDDGPGGPT